MISKRTKMWGALVLIAITAATLIVSFILFNRWFDRERVNFEVREVRPGVYCAIAIGTANRSISCWKEDANDRRRQTP